ncbi:MULTISPECIES: TetR/AcrR family transcriptional regulator [unclassified Streptomyces]|uniref:TetR/AcrR family transcriptional regulator n=1 Tax=unclassified Streptomyces TaxID=2593676 RepID=UPI00278C316A|nr:MULTISPECIES: TetR/AcrR family transcriptional regulator [unclassified Streptomyces]
MSPEPSNVSPNEHSNNEPSLREAKKHRTREQLRDTAIRLAAEHGPGAVTVQDICRAVGVSPRTFFNYFDAKEDAFFVWDQQLTRKMLVRLAQRPLDEPPLTSLRLAIEEVLPVAGADGNWPVRRRLLADHPELIGRLAHSLRTSEDLTAAELGRRMGVPAESLHPMLLAGAAMTALRTTLVTWTPRSGVKGLRTLLREAFTEIESGLPGPPH